MVKFSDWLDAQLEERNWTRAELARRSGIHQSTLSMIYNGLRNVGTDSADAIANAFHLPASVVYIAAGLLPESENIDEYEEQVIHLLHQLPPEDREEILELIKFKITRTENLSTKTSSRGKPPARTVLGHIEQ